MSKIKISCIIPVYNVERYLCQTIESLRTQTLDEIEIICVNDCSQDSSAELLNKWKEEDQRVQIINAKKHQGAAMCRNKGLLIAQGEFIIFLDADDFFYKQMLEQAYNLAVHRNADLVVFGYERIMIQVDERGNEIEKSSMIRSNRYREYERTDIDRNLLKTVEHVPWNKLIRRSFLNNSQIFFQDIPSNNDVFFSLAITLKASKIVISDEILMKHYFGRKDSITQGRIEKECNIIKAYSKLYAYVCEENIFSSTDLLDYILDDVGRHLSSENVYKDVREDSYKQLQEDVILMAALKEHIKRHDIKGHNMCFARAVLKQESVTDWNYNLYYLEGLLPIMEYVHKKRQKIALWGCGVQGKRFIDMLCSKNKEIDFVIDIDTKKQGTIYKHYYIYAYEDVKDRVDVILVLNPKIIKEISEVAEGKVIIDLCEL